MSNNTRSPDPDALPAPVHFGSGVDAAAFWGRLALALAYPLLAHAAGTGHDGTLAALALADIVVLVLLQPLLQRRAAAWLALAASVAGLAWLAHSGFALLPLLLVPVAFVAWVAWRFGRSLRAGRVPLIGRIVAASEAVAYPALAADLRRYARGLTAAWALLLAALAACNLALALLAQPAGLLASLGIAAPLAVSQAQWSWFANISDYAIIGGFMLLEFGYRQRRFPGRHRNLLAFGRQMARLGPAFWRDLLR